MRERFAHQRLSVQAVEVWRGGGVEGRKGGQVWWCVDGARLKDEREMDEGWGAIGTRKAISAGGGGAEKRRDGEMEVCVCVCVCACVRVCARARVCVCTKYS